MIHKIHQGDELPSVVAGRAIQDRQRRLLGRCFPAGHSQLHQVPRRRMRPRRATTGRTQPSKAACSSCHDDVYFGAAPDPLKPYQTVSHATPSGVADPADSTCTLCHGAGKPEDVAVKHDLPNQGAKFKFNIVSVTGGNTPVIEFSVLIRPMPMRHMTSRRIRHSRK